MSEMYQGVTQAFWKDDIMERIAKNVLSLNQREKSALNAAGVHVAFWLKRQFWGMRRAL